MWETTDPDGRRVVMSLAAWRHLTGRHPELVDALAAILRAVAEPAATLPGHEPHEEWFYGQGFGPSRFVRVVVHFGAEPGRIGTAFPRRRLP